MRVTQQKTRQALLTVGEVLDPNELPEKLELFNADGDPLDIPRGARRVVSFTTEILTAAEDTGKLETREPGEGESGAVELGAGVILTHITVNQPCRVRFYSSPTKRDSDELRDRNTDPTDLGGSGLTPNHGCLSEFLLLTVLSLTNIPPDYLVNDAGETDIYYRIDNFDLTDGAVTVDLTIKDVEQ